MALPLIVGNKEQVEKILSDLRINEARRRRMLEVFKDWIRTETYMPDDIDDKYLSNYLALCKDDLVKAKKKFEINIISYCFQLFLDRSSYIPIDDFIQNRIARQIVIVPNLTEDGYRIVYFSLPKTSQHYDLLNTFKYAGILLDTLLLKDTTAGVATVIDCANCSAEIIAKVDVAVVSSFFNFIHEGVSACVKNFHLMNVSSITKPIIALIKAVLPEKNKKRILIHDNVDKLSNFLQKHLIPADYGGTLSSLDDLAKDWENYYLQNEEWRSELRKLTVRNAISKEKRHLDPSYGFGTDGTFRNLHLDYQVKNK